MNGEERVFQLEVVQRLVRIETKLEALKSQERRLTDCEQKLEDLTFDRELAKREGARAGRWWGTAIGGAVIAVA